MRFRSRKGSVNDVGSLPYVPREVDRTSESTLKYSNSAKYNIRTPSNYRFDPYNDVIEPFYHMPPNTFKDIRFKTTKHIIDDQSTDISHVLRFVPFEPSKDWCHPLDCKEISHCNGVLSLFIGCRCFYSGRVKNLETYLQIYNVVQTISSTEEVFALPHKNRYKCHDCRKWNRSTLCLAKHDNKKMKPRKDKSIEVEILPGADLISDLYDNYKGPVEERSFLRNPITKTGQLPQLSQWSGYGFGSSFRSQL